MSAGAFMDYVILYTALLKYMGDIGNVLLAIIKSFR